jgi:GT2 family glycosyltransferase
MTPEYYVYVSDRGNIFMTEIAAVLAAALGDLGYEVLFPAPGLPEVARNRINVVVAPHEFFPLQRGVSESALQQAAEASVSLGVEQPGTHWFELGTQYAACGPVMLDISRYSVEELTNRGHNAMHLQLGYHPMWDRWGGEVDGHRRTDVLYLGSTTARRDAILGRAAPFLWDWNTDLRLFEFSQPMYQARGHFVGGSDKWDVLSESRVLLNIHRNDVPYFEWVRVLEAVVNGCLVVTEVSTDYGPLVPGEHIVAVPAELLGPYVSTMLVDEERRQQMTLAAYDLIRTKFELTSMLSPICEVLDGTNWVKSTRSSKRSSKQLAAPPSPSLHVPPSALRMDPFRADALEAEQRVGSRVKELLDGETELVQQVEALQARLEHGSSDHAMMTMTSAWDGFEPEVSVILTSYNYEALVGEAIASVVASLDVAVELIVIDDHSSDGSVQRIRHDMVEIDWFPMALAARSANAGVSTARNFGASIARGGKLFMLDADNVIHPRSLRLLAEALEAEPEAAFSYGILSKEGEHGLLSATPWDVVQLAQGNYIDAMAMVRRGAFDSVGGYDRECGLWGWEDYDLWLRLADGGYAAAFVASLVGVYRVHAGSRQETVNLDTSRIHATFRRRYPSLPWPLS